MVVEVAVEHLKMLVSQTETHQVVDRLTVFLLAQVELMEILAVSDRLLLIMEQAAVAVHLALELLALVPLAVMAVQVLQARILVHP
jgi:hypothetical protein